MVIEVQYFTHWEVTSPALPSRSSCTCDMCMPSAFVSYFFLSTCESSYIAAFSFILVKLRWFSGLCSMNVSTQHNQSEVK